MKLVRTNILFIIYLCFISSDPIFVADGQYISENHKSAIRVANVAYVEVTSVDKPSSISQPCNIVLFDIDRKLRESITNDSFVNDIPTISPDGKHILFVSNRGTDYQTRLMLGDMAPKQIYSYDTENKTVSLFLGSTIKEIGVWKNIIWSNKIDELIVNGDLNSLFSYSLTKGLNKQIMKIEEDGYISSMSLSPSGNFIAFDFTVFSPIQFSLRILDINQQKSSILQTSKRLVTLCDWSPDGKKLLICDSLLKFYDVSSGNSQCLNIPGEGKVFYVGEAKYISDYEIILLAKNELYRYFIRDHRLVQLTSDGKMKNNLTIRSTFRNYSFK